MRHIRTNHNPLTVSDILLENGTARLEDFYPLTKVKTASDKKKLLSQGYNPGYTVSEWPYALPVNKIYYSKHLIPSTYYYDPDNEAIPIALCLNTYGTERIPIIPDSDQFCEYILDFAASLQNPDKDKIFSYLYNQDDGIRSQLLAEYIRRSSPSPELFDLFQMLYTVTDYNAGEYGTDLLQKLAFCRSDAQIQKIHNALADYPEELIVYRGEAEGSTNYRKAISWSLDINTAFFFACRHGDQNHARIIRARIHKQDVIAVNLDSREKEIIAVPGVPIKVTVERLIGPDSSLLMPFHHLDEYRKSVEQIRRLYKLYQRSGTDHGQLHSARVLFLALAIIQSGKIKLSPMERTQLLTAIVFHDIGRADDGVDDGHGKASRQIYETRVGKSLDPAVSFLIEYHCLDDKLAEEYLKSTDTIRAKKRTRLLYQILKDADALDRVRFGIYDLDVNQLRLPISHKLVPLAVTAVTGIKI
jgi:hypothetical protein